MPHVNHTEIVLVHPGYNFQQKLHYIKINVYPEKGSESFWTHYETKLNESNVSQDIKPKISVVEIKST